MNENKKKIQVKTDDGLVYYGDLVEFNASKIIINNATFIVEGNSSITYEYIDKVTLSRQASLDRENIIWLSKA